jgi:uridine kinase
VDRSPLIVGIAGGTGSGKTTLTRKLKEQLGDDLAVIEHDNYYKDRSHVPEQERESLNFDEPDALDSDLLISHLERLRRGEAADCPQYDFATHTRRKLPLRIEPAPLIAVEGILLLAVPELARTFDLAIFVETSDDLRILRRIHRDMVERGRSLDSIEEQYHRTVRPMHLLHVEPSRRRAHLIVPEGGQNAQALDVIVGRLRYLLAAQTPWRGAPG